MECRRVAAEEGVEDEVDGQDEEHCDDEAEHEEAEEAHGSGALVVGGWVEEVELLIRSVEIMKDWGPLC